jgi:hypothetical protein
MGHQPDLDAEPAGDPDPDPEPSASSACGDAPAPSAHAGPGRESRAELLAGFARGGAWDARPPGPELAAALATAAGPGGGARTPRARS